jgi:ATP-binding cassette subfamily B protein
MIRKILTFTTTGGKWLIAAAGISFVIGELSWAYLMYIAVNTLSDVIGGVTVDVWQLAKSGAILLAIKALCTVAADLTKHYAGFAVVENVRVGLIRKLKKLSLGFFTKERLGELSTVVHKDVDTLEGTVGHFLCVMWSDILIAAVIGAWLFSKSIELGLCMISLLPVALFLLFLGLRKAQASQKRLGDDLADMVSLFVEYTKGMPLQKAFSENTAFAGKLDKGIERFGASSRRQSKLVAGYIGRFGLFFELSMAVTLIFGVLSLINGDITLSVYLYFVIFAAMFYKPFAKAEQYFLEFVKIKDSYRRVSGIMEADEVQNPTNPVKATAFDISFEDVNFSYQSDEAEDSFSLKDINFHVPQGSLAALVGPSGSGKTTVTNLLLRFWDADSGRIKVGGKDIREMDYDVLLGNISVVMQNVYLKADSIFENIRFGKRDATLEEVRKAAKKAQIHDFISGLPQGYDTPLGENGVGLSGGQKQRISIARAFLKDAPIVLLDEMTSSVDPINEVKIQRAVGQLAKNRTVIVIAHHLRTIRAADQILVFDGGSVSASGQHEELLRENGLYARLWEAQEAAHGWEIA